MQNVRSPGSISESDARTDGALAPRSLESIRGRFRGLILLAGSPREGRLARAIGRSVLDLPVRSGSSILAVWAKQAAQVAEALGVPECRVRVILNKAARKPEVLGFAEKFPSVKLSVEFDREEFRGTGGLLRDLAEDYLPGDLVLVCNGNQVVLDPLAALLESLVQVPSDVGILASEDGAPLGLKLFDAGIFREIKAKGFVDLNEQALPELVRTHDVRVVTSNRTAIYPVRELDDYIHALHAANTPESETRSDPLAEDWFESFRLVEEGATIGAGARVHDSIVLKGGRVGAGALLVRSVVCPGAEVAAGEVVSDQVVSSGASRAREASR